jgi:hypothetical protein
MPTILPKSMGISTETKLLCRFFVVIGVAAPFECQRGLNSGRESCVMSCPYVGQRM